VTRLRDGTVQAFATLPQTVDGVTLAIAGAPAAGDYFLVQPTRAGARDFAVAIADPALVAAAAPMRGAAAVANRGNATISAGSVNAPPPPNANIAQTVTLTFTSPTTFDVTGTGTGNPAGVAYASGGAISYNGWTFSITGTPAAGDTFTVSANASGTGDNRNALALASLQTATLLDGATTTFQGAYATLVSDVGNQARTVDVTLAAQTKLLEEASAARESAAGVNLDEEAASLLRYQQAYQAAAKVMATASTLFDEILAIMR
jgi:flagellar hook-associated protein 1 FlgK